MIRIQGLFFQYCSGFLLILAVFLIIEGCVLSQVQIVSINCLFFWNCFGMGGGVKAFFSIFVGIEHNLCFSPVDFGIVLFQLWESYNDQQVTNGDAV
jgi:hypothetical protein